MKPTEPSEFIASLNGGVFAQQLARAISDVAGSVIDTGKKGEINVKLKLSQIGESTQVKVSHTLEFTQPTKRGCKREDVTLDTPMYVTTSGVVLFQQNPTQDLIGNVRQTQATA